MNINSKAESDSINDAMNDRFAEKMIDGRKIMQLTRSQIERVIQNTNDFKRRDRLSQAANFEQTFYADRATGIDAESAA